MAQSNENGATAIRQLADRIGSLEGDFKRLETELRSFAQHTSEQIENLAGHLGNSQGETSDRVRDLERAIDVRLTTLRSEISEQITSVKVPWLQILALVIGLVGGGVGLAQWSMEARVKQVEIADSFRDRITELEDANTRQSAASRSALRDVEIGDMRERIEKIEMKISTRFSDADDRQDAELRGLRERIDMLHSPLPSPAPGSR